MKKICLIFILIFNININYSQDFKIPINNILNIHDFPVKIIFAEELVLNNNFDNICFSKTTISKPIFNTFNIKNIFTPSKPMVHLGGDEWKIIFDDKSFDERLEGFSFILLHIKY